MNDLPKKKILNKILILILVFLLNACAAFPPQNIVPVSPTESTKNHIPILTSTPVSPVIKKTSTVNGGGPPIDFGGPLGNSIFGASILPSIGQSGGLNSLVPAGLLWTRIGIDWKTIESSQGNRKWTQINAVEEELLKAVQAGLKVVVILGETPPWAVKPGFNCGVIREDLFGQFASFAKEAVARYSQPPYNIRYWEIINEPDAANFLGCWGDPADTEYYGGKTYGRMLSKVYPAIKSADPNAQVLVGGLLLDCDPINPPDDAKGPGQKKDCTPGRFMEGILASGATNAFDGIAFHSYDYYYGLGMYSNPNWGSDRKKDGSSTIAKAAYLRSLLDKYKVSGRYLINTEFAIFCGRTDQPDCDEIMESVETTKAYYIVQFAATAVADGYRSAIWYATQGGRNNALFNADLSPKPVFYAYQFANNMIGSSSFVGMVDLDPDFKIYEFKKNDQVIWVVWTLDGNKRILNIPKLPAAFYRILSDGQASSEPPSQRIEISLEPVFLVFK